MTRVALLSDLQSPAACASLPQLRARCGHRGDIFHYEIDAGGDVAAALRTVARVRPRVLAINGGDATLGTVMTAMAEHRPFGDAPPPIALLAGGRGDLVPHALGSPGCAVAGLDRAAALAVGSLTSRVVHRTPIVVRAGGRSRLGMMLRHRGRRRGEIGLSPDRGARISGRFSLLLVTALGPSGRMTLVAIRGGWRGTLSNVAAAIAGRLGAARPAAGHRGQCDSLAIDGADGLLLDGAPIASGPVRLEPAEPVGFLRLAA